MSSRDPRARVAPLIFEHTPCLAFVLDPQLHIVLANPAFEYLFGQDCQGRPCYSVLKDRQTPCDPCVVARSFADGQPHVSEEEGVNCQGKTTFYEVRTVPLVDDQGQVDLVLQLGVDTSRVTELEQGLKQAERLANVGLTTAGLAHTIKNILAGLEGGTYVVSSGLERGDSDRIKGGWEMVQKYIDQVTSLVKNLLQYSKTQTPQKEPVAPAALVEEVAELYRQKAQMANIQLDTQLKEGLQAIPLERQNMHACLANLVANAIDACTWDPDDQKQHRIVLSARPGPQGGVTFQVTDNGMGVSWENQRKVLASHFTTKGIRGTGLGLLLTKKAVEEHDGQIDFSSTPGQGTTFTIEIPDQPDER